jgi:hypothetical protein
MLTERRFKCGTRPRVFVSPWGTSMALTLRRYRWIVGGVLLAALAMYHQWLGVQFSNRYFRGDSAQILGSAKRIALNVPPGLLWAGYTKSPLSALIYGVVLLFTHDTPLKVIPGVYPVSTSGFVYALAALATLVCLLTGLVAWRYTASLSVGLTAMVLVGVYAPFVINAERALSEIPFTICLLLLFLFAHEAFVRPSILCGFLAAASAFLAIAARTQYVAPILALGIGLLLTALGTLARRAARDIRRHRAESASSFRAALPFLRHSLHRCAVAIVTLATLLLVVAAGYAVVQKVPPADRLGKIPDNTLVVQSTFAYALTDGWQRDAWYTPLTPRDPSPLERDAALLTNWLAPTCTSGSGPYRTLVCLAMESPGFAARRALINEQRLWWYPYNDFRVSAGLSTALLPLYHRFLILAGMIGGALLVLRRRWAAPLFFPFIFIAMLFSVQETELRYALPALPFLIIGAADLLVTLARALVARGRSLSPRILVRRANWRAGVLLCIGGGALLSLLGGRFLFMAYGATRLAVLLTQILPLFLLGIVGPVLLVRAYPSQRAARIIGCLLVALLVIVAAVPAASASTDGWSVTLARPEQQLVQKILLSAAPSDDQPLAVLLDAQALDGDFSDLALTINDHPVALTDPERRPVFLTQDQMAEDFYSWPFDLSHGQHDAGRIAQWLALPIPTSWVRAGENDITVSLRANPPHPHPVRLFGQFSPAHNEGLTLPSLFETSLWKYEFDGDARINLPANLTSTARYALYRDRDTFSNGDLSPARGLQRGTYHIFLGALTPAYVPDPGALPPGNTLNGALAPVDPAAPINSFWFYASASSATRISLLDDHGTRIVFPAGQAVAQRWHAAGVDVAYAPAYRVGRVTTPLDERADPLLSAAPVQLAMQTWYTLQGAPSPGGQVGEMYTGAYVVQFSGPPAVRNPRLLVTPINGGLGSGWAQLIPRHYAAQPPEYGNVDLAIPPVIVRNIGTSADPAASGPVAGPSLFMVYTGDLPADGVVTQAALLLQSAAIGAQFEPAGAPYRQEDRTARGALQSYWTYGDPKYGTTGGSALLTMA